MSPKGVIMPPDPHDGIVDCGDGASRLRVTVNIRRRSPAVSTAGPYRMRALTPLTPSLMPELRAPSPEH